MACLENAVRSILGAGDAPLTSSEICSELQAGARRLDVNVALHALKTKGLARCTGDAPPRWSAVREQPEGEQPEGEPRAPGGDGEELMYCIVDLGNTHDCLQRLIPYAERGAVRVMAYADMAFRGFGVCPAVDAPHVSVFQSDTPDKNSADVQIIWDVCKILETARRECPGCALRFLVATKDLGFTRLKALVEQGGLHSLTFVTNWQALRVHIE